MAYFPNWRLTDNITVLPDERLPTAAAVPMGISAPACNVRFDNCCSADHGL